MYIYTLAQQKNIYAWKFLEYAWKFFLEHAWKFFGACVEIFVEQEKICVEIFVEQLVGQRPRRGAVPNYRECKIFAAAGDFFWSVVLSRDLMSFARECINGRDYPFAL